MSDQDKENAELQSLRAEVLELRKQVNESKESERELFLKNLMSLGILAPALKDRASRLLEFAEAVDNGGTLCFSEGESMAQQIKDYLSNQLPCVITEEIATPEKVGVLEFGEDVAYQEGIPEDIIELDQKIRGYMKEHKTDYKTAFDAIHNL